MNRFIALLRREFWENRGAFVITPIVIGVIYLLGVIVTLSVQFVYDSDDFTLREGLRALEQQSSGMVQDAFLLAQLGPFTALFAGTLGAVVFFYLLGSLYDDRKDRSILFWKSLPASDTLTVVSKLVTAMVVAPLLFFVILVATHLLMMAVIAATAMLVGMNPWGAFLTHLSPLSAWGLTVASWLSMSVWALPLYGWLMLVSAFAPRIPLLFAVVPPLIFAFLQAWFDFLQTFTLGHDNLMGVFWTWLHNSPLILSVQVDTDDHESMDLAASLGVPGFGEFDHAITIGNMLDRLVSTQMLVGFVLAALFLAAALWLRRRATDN